METLTEVEYGGVVPIPIFFPNPVPNSAGLGVGIPSGTSTGSGPGLKSLFKAGSGRESLLKSGIGTGIPAKKRDRDFGIPRKYFALVKARRSSIH